MICSYTENRECEKICKKIIISLKAELVNREVIHSGVIENISECGLYIITHYNSAKTLLDFSPGKELDLQVYRTAKERLQLKGKVKWSYKTPHYGLTNSMGMEIIDPLKKYIEFYRELLSLEDKNNGEAPTIQKPYNLLNETAYEVFQ